jgi:hypothetical protein
MYSPHQYRLFLPRLTAWISAFCILALLVFVPANASATSTLRTVALAGQPAPGTSNGVVFTNNDFSDPGLNSRGQTVFSAHLVGSGIDNSNLIGIWSEGTGALGLVARSGSHAPGTPEGFNFSGQLFMSSLNAAGETAFLAGLATSENRIGIWSSDGSGSANLVARQGSPAASIPADANYVLVTPSNDVNSLPRLNDAGQMAFFAGLAGSSVTGENDEGIWAGGTGSLAMVARGGSQVPGLPSGVIFNDGFGNPALNVAGQVAFYARLAGPGVGNTNNQSIWSGNPGTLRLVARSGDLAPGTVGEVRFSILRSPALNASGKTAFNAFLTGTGVSGRNSGGIWSEGFESLHLVARGGSQAPGAPIGFSFLDFAPPVLNDMGRVAFSAALAVAGSSVTTEGIWLEGAGGLSLVALQGNSPPGVQSNARFLDFQSLVLNARGQIALEASLTFGDDKGIWATDTLGVLHLIAASGDQLEVAPNDFRTIRTVDFAGSSGNGDGRTSGFNDTGEVAFAASFTDGTSGIFVSNLVAVSNIPEPALLPLVILGLVGASIGRHPYRIQFVGD